MSRQFYMLRRAKSALMHFVSELFQIKCYLEGTWIEKRNDWRSVKRVIEEIAEVDNAILLP